MGTLFIERAIVEFSRLTDYASAERPHIQAYGVPYAAASSMPLGSGVVSGQIKINGVAQSGTRVVLISIASGVAVASTSTNASGNYSFTGLGAGNYVAVPIDPTYSYRSKAIHTTV